MSIKKQVLVLMSLYSMAVSAADSVNVSVTGRIIAGPCIVNGGNTNLDVNLGSIQASNMVLPNSTSTPVGFNLQFTNCPASTRSITVTFSGNPDPVAGADYYKNTGTAANVAIGLIRTSTGTLQGSGASITQSVLSDGTATLAMQAQVYSSVGGAMPGTINAVVVTTMQYN